jgi:hypothetical protein
LNSEDLREAAQISTRGRVGSPESELFLDETDVAAALEAGAADAREIFSMQR